MDGTYSMPITEDILSSVCVLKEFVGAPTNSLNAFFTATSKLNSLP